jgi:predicted regulator of Ras-like GTPase activity (Roadblock/LC7/MglB family)/tetratricopeptide (TPR) repeat protein
MAGPDSEQKITEMEDKLFAMPGSRIFVSLAEEYRRAGRFEDALGTLRTGLASHPGYLSAQIAIARLYQEMGRSGDAIEAFSTVIASDRENLVAAKALAELYLARGDRVEAVKKFKLYRGLSGDHSLDDQIAGLEREIRAGAPPEPEARRPVVPPEPISSAETLESLSLEPFEVEEEVTQFIPTVPASEFADLPAEAPLPERAAGEGAAPPLPESTALEPGVETVVLKTVPPGVVDLRSETEDTAASAEPERPASRTLADLYFTQGHFEDAKAIFERLAREKPGDPEIETRLSEIRARIAARPAAPPPPAPASRLRDWLTRLENHRDGSAPQAPRGFRPILEDLAGSADGVAGVSLIGRDGLAVESAGAEGAVEAVAAEMMGFLQTVASAEAGAERGDVKMAQVNAEGGRAILTSITDEYYLLLLISPDGNAGRARYEGWKAAARLEKELS